MYPVLWALEHAPIVDAEERAILGLLVAKGDFDGCNCYRSYPTLAKAARCDPKTARRKCHAMEERGLIRRQPGPKPKGWHDLPKDKRSVVWEVMIPASYWSTVQLEHEINPARAERGRAPITAENRPDLSDAPPKKERKDKGQSRPHRRKKSERGDSKSRRKDESGGTQSPVAGGLKVPSRGDSKSPNPPMSPPDTPSSLPALPTPDSSGESGVEPQGGEDGASLDDQAAAPSADGLTQRAEALVDDAVSRWGRAHRAPGPRDRQRLAERVAAELENGGQERTILDELTRDLGDARSAVGVVLGARTTVAGWGRSADPRPDHSQYVPTGPLPAWCGTCDERTRLVAGRASDGSERLWQCRRCHPSSLDNPPQVEELRQDLEGHSHSGSEPASGFDKPGISESAAAAADRVRQQMADKHPPKALQEH